MPPVFSGNSRHDGEARLPFARVFLGRKLERIHQRIQNTAQRLWVIV
jgi:hypothetical protein